MIWIQANGDEIEMSEMTDEHLHNTIAMLERLELWGSDVCEALVEEREWRQRMDNHLVRRGLLSNQRERG